MVELLQAIKEKSVTLDTVRHAPHPLCKSPPAQISGETHSNEHTHAHFLIVCVCVCDNNELVSCVWLYILAVELDLIMTPIC